MSVALCIPTYTFSKRQSTQGIVTGIDSRDEEGKATSPCDQWSLTTEPGHPFLRLEVRDMQANYPDQWNLYLLALDQMHVADQDDPFSYYGLASEFTRSIPLVRI